MPSAGFATAGGVAGTCVCGAGVAGVGVAGTEVGGVGATGVAGAGAATGGVAAGGAATGGMGVTGAGTGAGGCCCAIAVPAKVAMELIKRTSVICRAVMRFPEIKAVENTAPRYATPHSRHNSQSRAEEFTSPQTRPASLIFGKLFGEIACNRLTAIASWCDLRATVLEGQRRWSAKGRSA